MHRLITRKKKIISYEDLDLLAITVGRNSIKRNPLILDCIHSIRYKARIYPRIKTHVNQNKQLGMPHHTNPAGFPPLVCRGTALSHFYKNNIWKQIGKFLRNIILIYVGVGRTDVKRVETMLLFP